MSGPHATRISLSCWFHCGVCLAGWAQLIERQRIGPWHTHAAPPRREWRVLPPPPPPSQGMTGAYQNAFQYVGLSGPTYFTQLIRTVHEAAQANAASGQLQYTVLLILTDGQANDVDETARAIIDASSSPLSIIIVGVGGADFSAMEFLDADDTGGLVVGGRRAARDAVQFVPFRRFAGGSRLAAEVLKELPQQVVEHFMARRLPPPPPLAAMPVPMPAPPVGVGSPTSAASGAYHASSAAASPGSPPPYLGASPAKLGGSVHV